MDSADISDFNIPHSDSHLLSESLLFPSSSSTSSRTGPGGDDLSLSELSLPDQPPALHRRPFSLLARSGDDEDRTIDSVGVEEDYDGEDGLGATVTQEDVEKAKRLATKTREEKLQHDLFILKKLNSAFETYKIALREIKSGTERVAIQLGHTNALLDKYVKILSRSEQAARLILNERWEGAEADEEAIERERLEALERARQEEEERAAAVQREQERQERLERERQEREEQERTQKERAEISTSMGRGSGVRGVRGTRASMRAMARAVQTPSTRGARGGTSSSGSVARGRPGSAASVRSVGGTTRGIPRKMY